MPNIGTPFLNLLNPMLGDRSKDLLYPCIRDLVEHGLDLARFTAGESRPQRQDLTQYLAAWSRHAGLSEEQSSAWLIDYCATLLTPISKRTPAAVRHSTKSNLRYIYRSAVTFLCHCASNPFRAECRPDCPVYADMQAKLSAKAIEDAQPKTEDGKNAGIEKARALAIELFEQMKVELMGSVAVAKPAETVKTNAPIAKPTESPKIET